MKLNSQKRGMGLP